MNRTCSYCDHWAVYPSTKVGECRRHAPAPMYSLTGDKPGPIWWPQTTGNFWCGDFTDRAVSAFRYAENLLVPLKPGRKKRLNLTSPTMVAKENGTKTEKSDADKSR